MTERYTMEDWRPAGRRGQSLAPVGHWVPLLLCDGKPVLAIHRARIEGSMRHSLSKRDTSALVRKIVKALNALEAGRP